jgi:hypothetical protein
LLDWIFTSDTKSVFGAMIKPLFAPMSIIREPSSVTTLLLPRTPFTLYMS